MVGLVPVLVGERLEFATMFKRRCSIFQDFPLHLFFCCGGFSEVARTFLPTTTSQVRHVLSHYRVGPDDATKHGQVHMQQHNIHIGLSCITIPTNENLLVLRRECVCVCVCGECFLGIDLTGAPSLHSVA